MKLSHKAAHRIFFWAGLYGIAILLPQYFLEDIINRDFPPSITHPEHFYGFIGTALAWQFAFLVIAQDVVRYRALIIPAVLEKVLFAIAVFTLYAQDRIPVAPIGFALFDLVLAGLFLLVFYQNQSKPVRHPTGYY